MSRKEGVENNGRQGSMMSRRVFGKTVAIGGAGLAFLGTEALVALASPDRLVQVEVTSWNGLNDFGVGLDTISFKSAYDDVKAKYKSLDYKEGYDIAYDRMSQIVKDPNSFLFRDSEEASAAYNVDSSSNFDFEAGHLVWNSAENDGSFSKAKDIRNHIQEQAKNIYKTLGNSSPTPWEVKALTNEIIVNTFTEVNGVITTRVTYDAKSDTRLHQPKRTVCAIYDQNTKIRGEYFDAEGNLRLSNEADLVFTFDLSVDGITSNSMEFSQITLTDSKGAKVKLSWLVHDLGSQPDNTIFGIPTPRDEQNVWVAQLLRPCGPAPVVRGKSTAIPASGGQPQTSGGGGKPGATAPFASPQPTNADNFTPVSPVVPTKDQVPPTNWAP